MEENRGPEVENFPETKQKDSKLKKYKNNPWFFSTVALAIIALILLLSNFSGGLTGGIITGGVVSEAGVGEKLLSYYESNGATGLTIDSVETTNGVYQVNFEYQGDIVPIFVTRDGKLAGSLTPIDFTEATDEPQSTEAVQSEKSKAELFIMTHCPYGTQAEKGFIPMMELMQNVADLKIRFVHYFMHDPEETETPRQVCIREEQSEKYLPYLRCFLEEGNSESCLIEATIDQNSMNECVNSGRAESYYAEDSELSQAYGVQGSPTLVVNGAIVNSGRDSASYLDSVCKGYLDESVPSLCGTQLSDVSPAPMWGWDTSSASGSDAQCG